MNDAPLAGYAIKPIILSSGRQYTDGSTGYLIEYLPELESTLIRVDILTLTAKRDNFDVGSFVQLYAGDLYDSDSWQPIAAAGVYPSNFVEGTGYTIYNTWVNETLFYLPLATEGSGLIWGVSNSGSGGTSWGSVFLSGALMSTIN